MRRVLLLTAVVLAAALAPVATANHGAGQSWLASPDPLVIVDNMTTDWDPHLRAAIADWDASTAIATTLASGSDAEHDRKKCRAQSGAITVCNAPYGKNGWLGVTTVVTHRGRIVKVRTRLNDTYFGASGITDPNTMRHVVCHELGHAFGLGHEKDEAANSCMTVTDGSDDARYLSPSAHDYQELESLSTRVAAPKHRTKRRGNNTASASGAEPTRMRFVLREAGTE